MAGGVRVDLRREMVSDPGRHDPGLIAPGPIFQIVHVTVTAVEIAATDNFDHESLARVREVA
ncbi:hypothetical protein GCM10011335_14700 [Aureimonas glaciei]|uniref:Uncharacterized protein n=1 Tax=Aureimonas glaciei TaxID=1776957 RepID=A0A917D984_9HYPH|nr:hypothetical protein GCM10011335_14700 [Aureimonas glaciei]